MWSRHRPSQGPGQQQSNREGKPASALAGRNGNLTMGLPIPSPRAPAVTVATTRFFFVLPSAPPEPTTPSGCLRSTWPACWVSRAPWYLLTYVYLPFTSAEVGTPCVRVCLLVSLCVCVCARAGRLPYRASLDSTWVGRGKEDYRSYLQDAITPLASRITRTRGPSREARHAVPFILAVCSPCTVVWVQPSYPGSLAENEENVRRSGLGRL